MLEMDISLVTIENLQLSFMFFQENYMQSFLAILHDFFSMNTDNSQKISIETVA